MIDVTKILRERETYPVIYSDRVYTRQKVSLGGDIELLIDTLNEYEMSIISGVVNAQNEEYAELFLSFGEIIAAPEGFLRTALDNQCLFWFPAAPMIRIYKDLLIKEECPCFYENETEKVRIKLPAQNTIGLEFLLVCFEKESKKYINEICNRSSQETRRLRSGLFLDTKNRNPFLRYYIRGNIYTERYNGKTSLAWLSEQNANLLYQYFQYLKLQTDKALYECLSVYIAYSVMLRLSSNGLWKHGLWTDLRETHFRFQIDGIDLLLSFYNKTKNKLFLKRAKSAIEPLIQIADRLNGSMIWFLHDTLETSDQLRAMFYKNFIRTNYLNKSASNTLCLNTHLQMLMLLKNHIDIFEKYRGIYQSGIKSLLTVIGIKKGKMIYSLIYGIRDWLLRKILTTNTNMYRKLHLKYFLFLKNQLLLFLKKIIPRLVMPNGYIERDLCASRLLDSYHFLTLRDFLFLSIVEPHEELLKLIKSSIDYTDKSGLGSHFSLNDPRANIFLDILWGYSCKIDDSYLRLFVKYLLDFLDEDISLSVDLFANPILSNQAAKIDTTCNNLLVFASPEDSMFLGLIVNPTEKTLSFKIINSRPYFKKDLIIMRPECGMISADEDIVLESGEYVTICRSNTASNQGTQCAE